MPIIKKDIFSEYENCLRNNNIHSKTPVYQNKENNIQTKQLNYCEQIYKEYIMSSRK